MHYLLFLQQAAPAELIALFKHYAIIPKTPVNINTLPNRRAPFGELFCFGFSDHYIYGLLKIE